MGDPRNASCLAELLGRTSERSETPTVSIVRNGFDANNIRNSSLGPSVQHHIDGKASAMGLEPSLHDGNASDLLDCLDGFDSDALEELEDSLDLKNLCFLEFASSKESPTTCVTDGVSESSHRATLLQSPSSGAVLSMHRHQGIEMGTTYFEQKASSAGSASEGRCTLFPFDKEDPLQLHHLQGPHTSPDSSLHSPFSSQLGPKYGLRPRIEQVSYRTAESDSDEETDPKLLGNGAKRISSDFTCKRKRKKAIHPSIHTQTGRQDHTTPAWTDTFPKQSVMANHATLPEALGDGISSLLSANLGSEAKKQPQEISSRGSVPELPSPQHTTEREVGKGTARESLVKIKLAQKIKRERAKKGQQPIVVDFESRPSGELTEEEKKKLADRKRRNVISAQKSRQRQRTLLEKLEREKQTLMAADKELDTEINALQKEFLQLGATLAAHQGQYQLEDHLADPKSSPLLRHVHLISRCCHQSSNPLTPADKVFNTWESQAFE